MGTGAVVIGLIAQAADSSGQHRWEDAIADFDEVLRLEPRNAEAFQKRGSVYYTAVEAIRKRHTRHSAIGLNSLLRN